jgi:uncharacterized protein (DUF302 family)
MAAYERVAIPVQADRVVETLRAVLAERGITEYAVVDHGRDMAAAGATAYPAWTLVFGSPAAGAKILALDLAAAVDIPLRLAVIGTGEGTSEIVLRDVASLLDGAAAPLAGGFTDVLRGLAEAARGRLVPVQAAPHDRR